MPLKKITALALASLVAAGIAATVVAQDDRIALEDLPERVRGLAPSSLPTASEDPLGGCVVKHDDPNTLLVAGNSENSSGAIYSIGVQRGPCGHIIGFVGSAQLVANTPYVDANLIYGPGNLMFYTGWPVFLLSQLPDGATSPARETNLTTIGMNSTGDSGPGGLGYVPPPLAAAGQMRTEFVCIPRPIARSERPDGGPIRYRVVLTAALWKSGERPRLKTTVLEGDVGLSI